MFKHRLQQTIKENSVTVLISGVEEVIKTGYDEAKEFLDQSIKNLEQADTTKEKIEASQDVKRASSRVQAYQFLQE